MVQGLQAWRFLLLLKELDGDSRQFLLKTFESRVSLVRFDLTLAAATARVRRGREAVEPEICICDYRHLGGLKTLHITHPNTWNPN